MNLTKRDLLEDNCTNYPGSAFKEIFLSCFCLIHAIWNPSPILGNKRNCALDKEFEKAVGNR